jgi:hypothetical protein
MEEIILTEKEIQNNFNESSMEELLGEAIIENNVNEESIEEVEDGD